MKDVLRITKREVNKSLVEMEVITKGSDEEIVTCFISFLKYLDDNQNINELFLKALQLYSSGDDGSLQA